MNDDWYDSDRQRNITVLTGGYKQPPSDKKTEKIAIIMVLAVWLSPALVYVIAFLNLLFK